MSVRTYLPSAQFLVIVGSLAISGGVVVAAQYYVSSRNAPSSLLSAGQASGSQAWEQSLADIQAQSGVSLPDTPNQGTIDNLLAQAQSDNLTDSIGRQLLVKLTSAGVQGLGSDIPTQDSIIAEAASQINSSQSARKQISISATDATDLTLHEYGNAVMIVFSRHPKASSSNTLKALAQATDTRDPAPLRVLPAIGKEYEAIADELSALPVPRTLVPLHTQATQDIYLVADSYPNMAKVVDDPLRGIAALQQYEQLMSEAGRVLTNIAETLRKGGILFSKDEPGAAWDVFLSAS